jgi:hypothetical protein
VSVGNRGTEGGELLPRPLDHPLQVREQSLVDRVASGGERVERLLAGRVLDLVLARLLAVRFIGDMCGPLRPSSNVGPSTLDMLGAGS